MYTLYYSPFACSIAPHIVLEEIGRPYNVELMRVDLTSKSENITNPQYLEAINPKGRVPALKFGDHILTEAPAILFFLGRSHPEANLVPQDLEAEARCYEWMTWLSTAVHAVAFGQIIRPQRFVADAKDYPAVVAKGRQNAQAAWAYIEEQLQGHDWVVRGQYTIADPYLLFYYLGAKRSGLPMEEKYPAWTKVAQRVMSRPAVQSIIKQETAAAA